MAGMGLYDRFFSADEPVPKQKENQLLTEEPLSSRINVLAPQEEMTGTARI